MSRTYARNTAERCIQIIRWANERFGIFEPGAVRFEYVNHIALDPITGRETVCGMVDEWRGKLRLRISQRGNPTRACAIETLLHELAHIALWDVGRGLNHGDEFWLTYGRMVDEFHDRGVLDSKSYYVD